MGCGARVDRKTKQVTNHKTAKQSTPLQHKRGKPKQTNVYISELMCVTHNNPMRANQSTTLQIKKANHCKANHSKTMQTITAQTKGKRCISQRDQVRHTNHIKVLQSKTNQGKPMYKSGSSCASHLRAILFILPLPVRVSLDKLLLFN